TCESNIALPLHNQQDDLIIVQVFRRDANKCLSYQIGSLLFQLVQTSQALRQDYSCIKSAALGRAKPCPAAIADQQQDLSAELLPSGRDHSLQNRTIQVL